MNGMPRAQLTIDRVERDSFLAGEHSQPHQILGAHPSTVGGVRGVLVRAYHPDAVRVECLLADGPVVELEELDECKIFAGFIRGAEAPLAYRLRFHFADGVTWERDDPYRFLPTIGEVDLHLFNEGTHRELWKVLGAHRRQMDGVEGVGFAVWAPSARRVSVVGDFCRWDGRIFPMRSLGSSGIFEIFVPELHSGALYKFEIRTADGHIRVKTDPFAFAMEVPPGTASRVVSSAYLWNDRPWQEAVRRRDAAREPMFVYEIHAGSWARIPEEGNRPLTYRELAPRVVEHAKWLGFTHVELLPVCEHPFSGSWGYQVSGYFAPTSRYGDPDDLRYFVDTCHQNGIGVILDWVPAHFPKDDFALRWFDGTALYEHEDPRRGEHPDWGTLIFNYGRNEVRNFLIANALYWLREFHVDGLRVDAVASMLYLDYSRRAGEWTPNPYGGRENLDAVEFLKQLNQVVHDEHPGALTIAEESTAWPGVTSAVADGGLGFDFKWNMGWMHDSLKYFERDPLYRRWHQDQLSFAMIYEYSERFIMPLSHDEVVHGKGSLLNKMPGDEWQRFANLRLLLAYQFTRPGKTLLFMGTELAPFNEWNHEHGLEWHLEDDPMRAAFGRFVSRLGWLYRDLPALWQRDHEPEGFAWIDCNDYEKSVFSYQRRGTEEHAVVVLNLTPVPRDEYRVGVPGAGRYRLRLSSDDEDFGGSGYEVPRIVDTDAIPYHGLGQSLSLRLPPLSALILTPEG